MPAQGVRGGQAAPAAGAARQSVIPSLDVWWEEEGGDLLDRLQLGWGCGHDFVGGTAEIREDAGKKPKQPQYWEKKS